MLHRLGPEAADAIDEFLDLALTYDENEPPSLTQFLARLRAAEPEVKRDMDHGRDEVRVMTVHGAKGLEAPIVFLPDTCTTASGDNSASGIVKLSELERPDGLPEPIVWAVKGTSRVQAVEVARAAKEARDREERNRLLYVAMTRARDRLYVAGFENRQNRRGRAEGCWYDLIVDALTPGREQVDLGDGATGWRIEAPQTVEPEKPREEKGRQQVRDRAARFRHAPRTGRAEALGAACAVAARALRARRGRRAADAGKTRCSGNGRRPSPLVGQRRQPIPARNADARVVAASAGRAGSVSARQSPRPSSTSAARR